MKTCRKCHLDKLESEFPKQRRVCKQCRNSYNCAITSNPASKEKKKIYSATRYLKNEVRERQKLRQSTVSYRESRKAYYATRIDPFFRLRKNVSRAIRRGLKQSKAKLSFLAYIGYSIQELKDHLESNFEPWMSWSNYGTYNPAAWQDTDPSTWTWQIDHIVPQSKFHYTSMQSQEFRECWALSNLRPYSAKQNIIDNDRR